MKGGIAKTSFSALSPQFESCRFFCYCKFLEILRLSSASPLLFFFRHCWSINKILVKERKTWYDNSNEANNKAGHGRFALTHAPMQETEPPTQ